MPTTLCECWEEEGSWNFPRPLLFSPSLPDWIRLASGVRLHLTSAPPGLRASVRKFHTSTPAIAST